MSETVLVLGASETTWRYSFIATNMLLDYHHNPVLVGKREGAVRDLQIHTRIPEHLEKVDTVTLYLNPSHQPQWYNEIFRLRPQRVIFNPGTENPDFEQELADRGIEPVEACTLVMLRTGQW
jgi:predicted CoA-binding protein